MNYHNITHDDMNNGEGLRVVLWVAGCNHHCPECQNPQTWNPDGGIPFGPAERKEIVTELAKDYISGLTLSGGDPLFPGNRKPVYELVQDMKNLFPQKTVWLYTGYSWNVIQKVPDMKAILQYVDVLVDGEFDPLRADVSYPWAGSTNQLVINVHESIKEGRIVLYEGH